MPEPFVLLQLVIAVAASAVFNLRFALVRPVPERSGTAVILFKTLLDAHTPVPLPGRLIL